MPQIHRFLFATNARINTKVINNSYQTNVVSTAKCMFATTKSRRDNTLLTVGFSLRTRRNIPHNVPQGQHLLSVVPAGLGWLAAFRRLKPTVNPTCHFHPIKKPK